MIEIVLFLVNYLNFVQTKR